MDTHTRIKSTRFLTAATTFALAALILPMGLTGASAQTLPVTITVNSATGIKTVQLPLFIPYLVRNLLLSLKLLWK
jgi:hypothetical protein